MSPIDLPNSQPSLDISPIWTPLSRQKSENYIPFQWRLSGKTCAFLCWYHPENLSLQWWRLFWYSSRGRPHTCGVFNVLS
jgi:hypothetical protein